MKTVNQRKNEEIDLDKLKNEFRDVDFHPEQPEPPDKYMYAVHYENLWHTLNTYLKKPIKKPFGST